MSDDTHDPLASPEPPTGDDKPKRKHAPNRTPNPRVVALGECVKCGQVHEYCKGHKVGTDHKVPCGKNAMRGQVVCSVHGGSTANAKAKALERLAEEGAGKALDRAMRALGAKADVPVTDPITELARVAGRVLATMDASEALVAKMGADIETDNGADVRGAVKVFERAQDRAVKVLHILAGLGITERQVRIEEAQHTTLHQALLSVLVAHGADPTVILPALAAELRQMDALPTTGAEVDDDDDDGESGVAALVPA